MSEEEEAHYCDFYYMPSDGYGAAINSCSEIEEGELWVDNGEYASQVNYCPYCGFKAKVQVTKIKIMSEEELQESEKLKWLMIYF